MGQLAIGLCYKAADPVRTEWAALCLIAWLTASGNARAEHAAVRLSYALPAGELGCPDAAGFRMRVAARLGYDPFVESATGVVSAQVVEAARALKARVELRASDDGEPAVRELSGGRDDCGALIDALAQAVALALDPLAMVGSSAEVAESPHPNPLPEGEGAAPSPLPPGPPGEGQGEGLAIAASPSTPPPPSSPSSKHHLSLLGALGANLSFGLVPGVALGGVASFGARLDMISVELEGRVDTSVRAVSLAGHRIEATVLAGGIAPCAHLSWFSACALARLGVLQGRAPDVARPSLGSSFLATLGVGLRAEIPHDRGWAARFELAALLPVVRTELLVNQQVAWTAPPVYLGLSAAVRARLW